MTNPIGLDEAMDLAIRAAEEVKGSTYPNPPVGAVILDAAGQVAGVGGTRPPGQEHAEVVALAGAGAAARGGTAVVTLEPCNHQGRTGPCVDALAAAGVSRVVYAVADPNPQAAGERRVYARWVSRCLMAWPLTASRRDHCGSGYTSSAPDVLMSPGNTVPVSMGVVPPMTAPANGSPASSRGPMYIGAGHSPMPSWWEPAPYSPMTPAHRAYPGQRVGAASATARGGRYA